MGGKIKNKITRAQAAEMDLFCETCGNRFVPKYASAARFCSHVCMQKAKEPKWLPCGRCLAKVGFSVKQCQKLLRKGDLPRVFQRYGIKPSLIGGRTWLRGRPQTWWGGEDAERLWMEGYKPKFPDWSCIWRAEQSRRASVKRYREMTKEERLEWNRALMKRRVSDPDRHKQFKLKNVEWRKRNKKRMIDYAREYMRDYTKRPHVRARYNVRRRFSEVLEQLKKNKTHTFRKLIGCSVAQLAEHLELQFKKGMSWDNYGSHWHVDHIIPVSKFDHTDEDQVFACWHWTNLQPLEAAENMSKGNRITDAQMKLRFAM